MRLNRDIGYDIISGPFLIVGDDYDKGNFKSLTNDQLLRYKMRFDENSIIQIKNKIMSILMNKKGGFDQDGNLHYGPISKVVPNFEYVGSAELLGKTEQEKFRIINEYYSKGYYLALEVKGESGGQHWGAINDIKDNTINMVDPDSSNSNLWLSYNSINTSQIRYFKAKK